VASSGGVMAWWRDVVEWCSGAAAAEERGIEIKPLGFLIS